GVKGMKIGGLGMLAHKTLARFVGMGNRVFVFVFIALCTASTAFVETPLVTSNNAQITDSGLGGICLLCSVSDVDHLVDDDLPKQATMTLPVGIAGSAYACVGANRVIPAGRRGGFVGSLNNGLAGVLEGTTLITRLNGLTRETLS